MEDYYEYLDSNGVTTLYKLIKDDTVALIDSYSVTINGITTNLDTHVNNSDIHTPITDIENMVDTKISGLVNSAPETLDTLKELSDALGNDPNFATTVANQIGNKASKDDVYTKEETDTLLDCKANSVHNHVVSDITDFPTIPTKLSQLENDMGFGSGSGGVITSISWTNITDKPNFATVATSGSYTDLSNTPTIPTKVSQLENDTGFINALTDVVDTKSNQTIGGTKKFTSDIARKYTAVDITTTPTSDMYAHINFTDKNDKSVAYIQYAQKSNGVDYIGLRVRDKHSTTWGVQLNTNKEFVPLGNNSYSLGSSSYKWAKIYSDDVVHTSGNETISGSKTFSNQIYLGAGGGSYGQISAKDNNSILRLFGGTSASTGANLDLYGENLSSGGFSLRARTSDKIVGLDGKVDGTLKWNGKNIALDENLVHTSGDEYISGTKIFSNTIHRYADLTTSGYAQVYAFVDTNANGCGHTFNNVHWVDNCIHNRHGAYNNKSGKTMEIDITLNDAGVGLLYATGTATNGNLETVTSATGHTGIATMGWVNNPATSTNVVHKTGNEAISGVKSFNNLMYIYDNMSNKNSQMDLFTTPAKTLYSHYMFVDKNNEISAYMQYGQQNTGTDFIGLFIHDKNRALHGIQVTTNNEVIPISNNTYSLGSSSNRWANVHASRINCDNIVRTVENSYIYMTAGPAWNSGASIFLNGKSGDGNGTGAGSFTLYARNASAERYLLGRPDGILNWTGCIESYEFRSTTGNAFMAQYGSYTFLIRNDGSNTYFLMSDKDGVPGTWSTARPLTINDATGVCNINGNANSATYATTQATSDNSTRIATTAWVRNYVNSVVGTNTVGSSVSAYWSNSSNVTATGQASSGGKYPSCYSEYITKTPTVGTIYSGAQLYTVLKTYASATGSTGGPPGTPIYYTNTTAQAIFSTPINPSGKYLCTTANTVKFRAYTATGSTSAVGSSSVVDNSSTKSIFIRVQ